MRKGGEKHSLAVFLRLKGRPVVLVGEGAVADAQRRLLERAGARIVEEGSKAALAIVIDDIAAVSRLKVRGALVYAVDRPDLCDFTLVAPAEDDSAPPAPSFTPDVHRAAPVPCDPPPGADPPAPAADAPVPVSRETTLVAHNSAPAPSDAAPVAHDSASVATLTDILLISPADPLGKRVFMQLRARLHSVRAAMGGAATAVQTRLPKARQDRVALATALARGGPLEAEAVEDQPVAGQPWDRARRAIDATE